MKSSPGGLQCLKRVVTIVGVKALISVLSARDQPETEMNEGGAAGTARASRVVSKRFLCDSQAAQSGGHKTLLYGHAILLRHSFSSMVRRHTA